jgi:hypothetical protein
MNGDDVEWEFWSNVSGSWSLLNSSILVGGVGVISANSMNMDNYNMLYWWSVNVSDTSGSGLWMNVTYSFMTKLDNTPPVLFNQVPPIGSVGIIAGDIDLYISVYDIDGDLLNITFRTNASGVWGDIGSNISQMNGTYSQNYNFIEINHKYWWSVNVTDGLNWSNSTYYFSTEELILPDSELSPIKKYFNTKKILWTFDDYRIELNHHPPHKGFGNLSQQISNYGGHVNIMTIFTKETYTQPYNNEIRNYSVINDFGWSQNKINESINFFLQSNIYPQCHGWNHSADLNNANLSFAYKIMNHTLWNWQNNYDIKPNFFLGHSTSGNYNITLALRNFSQKYWNIYGENFRWNEQDKFPEGNRESPAIEYLLKPQYTKCFDPLFGCNWGDPCETLQEAKDLFNTSYYNNNLEILLIRGHPSHLNKTYQLENFTLWQDWIDWI